MAGYTDSELQEIASWLKEGLSASKIAAAFSALRGARVSRNAIIGIVHRNAMLGAIGFANGRGVPKGVTTAARQAVSKRTGTKPANGLPATGKAGGTSATGAGKVGDLHAAKGAGARKSKARPKRDPPPAWLPSRLYAREVGVLVADGEAYRLEVPVPPRTAIGRQPHGVAMRFIDCLFSRCRAPLDLTLEEDPENDAPGGRPGADMLCCGMRTRALKSYCDYHQARFRRRVLVAEPG